MKKQIVFLLPAIILSINLHSQIVFESGYFINDSNQRITCLIKNIDWNNNPTDFEYQLSTNEPVQKATMSTVKEFAVTGISKYIRATVNIDRSSDKVNDLSADKNPIFKEELLFLKVLIEGKASLYQYEHNSLTKYFYKIGSSEIKQLVYKRYLIDNNIVQNNYFKQQLFIDLKCQTIALGDIEYLNYSVKDLKKLFIKFNDCSNADYINYESKLKKDVFNLSLRPGLNYSGLTIQNSVSYIGDSDFEKKLSFRFGIETEFILPFNKNKWSIIAEPAYQYFVSEVSKEGSYISGGILVSKVNYKSIELPIGFRHYFYLSEDSKIFANISFVFDFTLKSSIEFVRSDGSSIDELDIKSIPNTALGLGYKFNNKYSLEMRYFTNREILKYYQYLNSNYSELNIILGITLF